MKTILLAAAAAAALAASAAAQQPAAPAQTIQQQFEAASAALEAENWAEGLRILEALEARVARTGNARSLAIVRVRKAQALLRLDRLDEAAATIGASLPLLPASDASLQEDRFRSVVALGRIAELRLDYREAAVQYRAAAAIPVDPGLRLAVYRGLVQTLMFYDAPAALAASDEGLRLAGEAAPGDATIEGQLRTWRGRVLLNMGRFREARTELERAIQRLGGLGRRVDLRDLVARSDLSIAALRGGAPEEARRYLALTGAGRMNEAAVPFGGRLTPPRCGNGISPADVAVVEIAIRDDGTVAAATPVYASTQGDAAVRFARAALDWSWLPEQVRAVEPIFRLGARLEVRCTLDPSLPDAHPAAVQQEVARWSAASGVPLELLPARNRTVAEMRGDLAAAEAQHGAQSPHLLRPIARLAAREDVPAAEREALLRRALPIARTARVPSPWLALLLRSLAEAQAGGDGRGRDTARAYLRLLDDPALAGDSYLAASLHLAAAGALFAGDDTGEAAAVLDRMAAIPGFGPDHPLRADYHDLTATVRMAQGNHAAAAAAWRSIPADGPRCASGPRLNAGTGRDSDFPDEAMAWGFEGWTVSETQVGADGRPNTVRTTVAYPPFVFAPASERIVGRLRFTPAFAPETGPCATYVQRVVYRLPGRR